MSDTALQLCTDPLQELKLLKRLVREVAKLGVRFRIAGADVEIDKFDQLPGFLQEALNQQSGLLRSYLAADDADIEALRFADELGVTPVLVETAAAARDAIRQLIRDLMQNGDTLGFDIETGPQNGMGQPRPWVSINVDGALSARQPEVTDRTALDPHQSDIQLLQLYAGGWRSFSFRGEALQLVINSHWLRRQRLVAHNAGFELSFIRHHGRLYRPPTIPRHNRHRIHCTAQAAGLLIGVGFGGEGRSLANAARYFLHLEVPKVLQTSDWCARNLSEGQVAYASSDAVLAWRLWPILASELCRTGRERAYELQRAAIPAVADMQLRGLGFDCKEHARQAEAWARDLAEARREYVKLTGQAPPTNPPEVRDWLARVLTSEQLATWPRTRRSSELSIENRHLKRLGHIESARPVLAMLTKAKLLSAFGAKLVEYISPTTGRIHCSYQIAGSKSGRFTATRPNLQQLPATRAPEFKRAIVAAPGNVMVGGDWSQIEMRAAAWLSQDPILTQLFADGRDIHAETAASIARIPITEVFAEQRQAAKPVNYGSIYGIQAESLAANAFADYGIEMTVAEAQQALDRFFGKYRKFDEWRWENWRKCKARGYVEIGCGRVVEAAWEEHGRLRFSQAANLPVQGVCADAMLRALRLVYVRLHDEGVRGGLVASVHDEVLLEVHESDAGLAREILEQSMVLAFTESFPGAPTTGLVAVKIGLTWADVK
jgi:DNA polymerase I-like protein with 3'-5' exonuclease and polymerase domains